MSNFKKQAAMTDTRILAMILTAMVIGLSPAWAQQPPAPAVDHSQMDHSKMGHDSPPPAKADTPATPAKEAGRFDHGSMQGGDPPPEVATAPSMARDPRLDPIGDARDPHAYSGGHARGPLTLADEERFFSFLMDRFEHVRERHNAFALYEFQARYGRDYDRAVLKAEGEIDGGKLHDARTELLWSHAVTAYWDTQLGLRHDGGEKPERKWLAFGVQGLAPYWFEVDATAYVGEQGHTALRFDAEYELLLTQRLILQPRFEANVYGQRDAQRELGSGLSDAAFGLRLRYEVRREFAPYIGIERSNKYGGSADFARAEGKPTSELRWVAGLRFWF